MRASDPRVRRQLVVARGPLLVVVGAGIGGAVLLILQAYAVTQLLLAAVGGAGSVSVWALVVLSVFVGRGLVGWVSDVAAARAAGAVGADLRRRVVGAILGGRSSSSSGSLAVLATRGVSAAEPYLTRYVPALVLSVVLPVLVLVVIAVADPLSGLVVLLTLPLIPIFGILVGLATRDQAASQWRAMATLAGHFLDVMKGLPTLVAFGRASAQSSVIAAVTDRYRRRTLATLRIAFASSAILELVATISVALVAVTVGVRLALGHIGLEPALLVLLLAPEAYWPLRRVGTEFHAAAEGGATLAAAADLDGRVGASCPPQSAESAHLDGGNGPSRRVLTAGASDPVPTRGADGRDLVMSRVSVSYPGRTTPAVAAVTATVSARGVTAIVGPSGAGKSTLLCVLAGLVAPTSGSVSYAERTDAWRAQVAWLPQRPVFVQGSIADNLRLAVPSASDSDLWRALKVVSLAERIERLPGTLDADLAEDGASLSAGERARLALARVVLSDRPWVLLDEPTAHLDEATEKIIVDTVADLGRTRGVIVVAHRPALVDAADAVVRVDPPEVHPRPAADRTAGRRPQVGERISAGSDLATGQDAPTRQGEAVKMRRLDLLPRARCADSGLFSRQDEPTRHSSAVKMRRLGGGLWGSALVGGLASACGVALTALAGWLILKASGHPGVLSLTVAMVGVRAFGLARPVLRYLERLWSHDSALRLLARRRVEVYDALVPLVPGALPRRRGDLLAGVVDDVDVVLDEEVRVRLPLRSYLVVAVLAVLAAVLIQPVAGAVVAVAAALPGVGYLLARRGAARAEQQEVTARAAVSGVVVEATQTATERLMWQAVEPVLRTLDRLAAGAGRATRTTAHATAAAKALVLVAAGAAVATVPLVAGHRLDGPTLALLVMIPLALAEPAATLADAGAAAAKAAAARARLAELASHEPAVTEPATATSPSPDHTVAIDRTSVRRGAISLDLPDLTLAPGTRTAIVGPSGSGKSTLAALMLRFLDPDTGTITLGGHALRELTLADVRNRIGLVDDDPHIFASTLAENVRLAKPDATDDEVATAIRRAHLGEWLDALPDGVLTRLGDGSAGVSGGERARIGVARSLLAGHKVLVLDEPVAHLDTATAESLAREVLDRKYEQNGHGVRIPPRSAGERQGGEEVPDDQQEAFGPHSGTKTVLWMSHTSIGLGMTDTVVTLSDRGQKTC